jgi:hypothetical protein
MPSFFVMVNLILLEHRRGVVKKKYSTIRNEMQRRGDPPDRDGERKDGRTLQAEDRF